jgi:hypothetical protein
MRVLTLVMSRLGRLEWVSLVSLGFVESEGADGVAVGGVGGDVAAVAEQGDGGPGVVAADGEVAVAKDGGAVVGDADEVDGGVVLAGQVAGATVGFRGAPEGVGGVEAAVAAPGVVEGADGVQALLQLGDRGGGGW